MKKEHWFMRVLPLLLAVAVLLSVTNIYLLQLRKAKAADLDKIIEEELRPATLELVKITLRNCEFCYDLEQAVGELKKHNVNITREEDFVSDSAVAQELISRYGITKLPTLIASGELNKSERLSGYFAANGEVRNERFIFTAVQPPYYDVGQNDIVGKVTVYHLKDSACSQCSDLSPVVEALQKNGVLLTTNKQVEYASAEGKELIRQFGIDNVPALLISDDIDYYESVRQQLQEAGATLKEGYYAVHSVVPPYRDLAQNKVVGLAELVSLTDSSCTVCYDVAINQQILQRLGVAIATERSYDIASSEGQRLKEKYQITKVPIILASPDASVYENFVQAWESVGSVEEDGWYVMRKPELLGVYKDLTLGEVVGQESGGSESSGGH